MDGWSADGMIKRQPPFIERWSRKSESISENHGELSVAHFFSLRLSGCPLIKKIMPQTKVSHTKA